MNHRILIVEDDVSFRAMLQSWFERNNFEVIACSTTRVAKKEILKQPFDIILTDLRLPDDDGIMLLAWIKEKNILTPVIIMTSYAEIQSAVSAIKLGAFDFLEKPMNPTILKQKIDLALTTTGGTAKKSHHSSKEKKFITGQSEPAQKVQEHIRLVAPTQMTVLIFGESGTGKEYAAKLIHKNSPRGKAPFIAVDCGSLSKDLAPSELFGHLKGSFTSAISDKKGIFEQAKGGTVFLDEVGNLSYEVQIQLLRALQEQKIRPVGSASDTIIDIRIIAATNDDLGTAIQKGNFREDLFHRLNEFSIFIPPLRERIDDLLIFTGHFLEEANEELDKNIKSFSKEAVRLMKQHQWNGNLRELRNVIRRATLFAQSDEIGEEHLPNLFSTSKKTMRTDLALHPENEKEHIETALKEAHGNKTLAAQLLKIDRKTLYNKMHRHGIEL